MKNASQSRPYGFTIVELLIVIVVIAIIATISIVAYSGVTNRSYDTAVQADLRNFAAKIMEFHALNDRYPNGFVALGGGSGFGPIEGIGTIGFSKSSYAPTTNNIYYCTNSSSFAVGAMSKSSTKYYFRSGGGIEPYGGAWTNANDICPGILGTSTNVTQAYGFRLSDGVWASWVK